MDALLLIARLERFPGALRSLLGGMAEDQALARPDGSTWSILEIVAHLADEETDDFRARLRSTLDDPARAWSPIDPEGSAVERGYRDLDLDETLDRFASERRESVAWLRSLVEPDWTLTHKNPSLGALSAGDLLVSWVAHDQLHLRQIAKRLYELVGRAAPDYSSSYAGAW